MDCGISKVAETSTFDIAKPRREIIRENEELHKTMMSHNEVNSNVTFIVCHVAENVHTPFSLLLTY